MTTKIECLKMQENINAMLDGELPESEKQTLESHLQSCVSCQDYLKTLQTLVKEIHSLSVEPPPSLCNSIMEKIAQENRPGKKSSKVSQFLGRRPFTLLAAAAVALLLLSPTVFDSLHPISTMDTAAGIESYADAASEAGSESSFVATNAATNAASSQNRLYTPQNSLANASFNYTIDVDKYNTLDTSLVEPFTESIAVVLLLDTSTIPEAFQTYTFTVEETLSYTLLDVSELPSVLSTAQSIPLDVYVCDDVEKYDILTENASIMALVVQPITQ